MLEAPSAVQEEQWQQRVLLLVSGDSSQASVHLLPDTPPAHGLVAHSPVLLHFWHANASTGAPKGLIQGFRSWTSTACCSGASLPPCCSPSPDPCCMLI